jgi:hypothetical protein
MRMRQIRRNRRSRGVPEIIWMVIEENFADPPCTPFVINWDRNPDDGPAVIFGDGRINFYVDGAASWPSQARRAV